MTYVRICRALVCLCVLACASIVLADANIVIKPATPLPAPSGSVINVSSISQFYSAINSATSGTTIMIQPGTYTLSSVPQLKNAGVTVRGSTGNRDDVVLVGGGMNNSSGGCQYGFQINVTSTPSAPMVIADLTIRDVYYHGIQIRGENSVSNVLIHNVKILNAGERFIKGSTATGKIASNVTIEYCWLEQNQTYVSRPSNSVDPDNYIGGIDAIGLSNWWIHDCYIKNIQGLTGGGRGGIFLWGGVVNCVAERNCIIGCDRDIAFGNPYRDPSVSYHSTNCTIRNNFVVGGASYGMELCASNNLKVYNNTVYCGNSGSNAVHVYDGVTTGLKLYSNLLRGQVFLNNSAGTVTADTTGSLIGASVATSWFVQPTVGDLRLTASATAAINHGQVLSEVTDDYFANPRDSQPDIGAFEVINPPHVTAFSPALAQVQSKTTPLTTVTISFDKNVTISSATVTVVGSNTGLHNDFTFSYSSTTNTATLQWATDLPNDTYVVTVSDAVTAGGLALDGEETLTSPVLPSGDGTAGGSFRGAIYRLTGDINADRSVNVGDLQLLVAAWGSGPVYSGPADLNADGYVNVGDLQVLVASWGAGIPVAN